jgi:hypothetical protein
MPEVRMTDDDIRAVLNDLDTEYGTDEVCHAALNARSALREVIKGLGEVWSISPEGRAALAKYKKVVGDE